MEYIHTLDDLIGDAPVSVQISAALERMAPKDHTHNYATRDEVDDLKKKIELLLDLVGDVSVSDQISMAIMNIK